MKTLISLLLASQLFAPTATAVPAQEAPVETVPSATTPAIPTTEAPVPTERPQYQSRQSISLFFGCRYNPQYPWCWR